MWVRSSTFARTLACLGLLAVGAADQGGARAAGEARPTPPYLPDRVLVAFRPGAGATQRTRTVERLGLRPDPSVRSPYFGRFSLTTAAGSAGVTVETAIASLRRDPAVRVAEPDWAVQATAVPNDPGFG